MEALDVLNRVETLFAVRQNPERCEALHLLKYIFPRRYDLPSPFQEGSIRQSTGVASDVWLNRDAEISVGLYRYGVVSKGLCRAWAL
jgi:hypothetical protein